MKILLSSHFFHPSVGGIEQVSLTLATEFSSAGYAVKVVTATPRSDETIFPFEVVRRPSAARLLELVHWSEVVFHNNISLRTFWPLILIRRPWVIAHHTWIARIDSSLGFRDHLKHFLTRFATNIAISQTIADQLTVPCVVIGNPYRDDFFQRDRSATRDDDLIFVGRLVPDKGVDILIHALRVLRERNLRPRLTIVGYGSERTKLQCMVERFRLEEQVAFLGMMTGKALAELLNRNRVIVVPSRWQEPFGLVALEGIACGCRAIVAESRGLVEAVGSLAVIFERENVSALADAIERTLMEQFDWENYWRLAEEHLGNHLAKKVAFRYLEVLMKALLKAAAIDSPAKTSDEDD
jgi:glycogen(starch) synthase